MKTLRSLVSAVVAVLVLAISLPAALADDETTLTKAVAAFKTVTAVTKNGIPPELFKEVQGVVIIPAAKKVDFMTSGKSAKGVLLVRGGEGKWSSPVFVTLSGGTLGWQIVGDPMDIVLLFKNPQTVESLVKKEKLVIGGKNAAVPGPLGKTLKSASAAELKAEINSYIFSHGEFSEANVSTTTLQIAAANKAFYGVKKVHAEEIVSGKVSKESSETAALQKLLSEAVGKK
jgi:lipid-binding SYLF domain-containing protein